MTASANDLEVLIEDYVEGRLEGSRREQFEARLKSDAALQRKVQTATQSIEMVRQVLNVDPAEDFEEKVSSQIIHITQSNPGMRPFQAQSGGGNLTADDPDAQLLHDPQADRERTRLMIIAAVAAVLFAAAVALMALAFTNREPSGTRPPLHGK